MFHSFIIASFLLSLQACGYKKPPYYMQDAPVEDENVKFILKKREFTGEENNESCK